MNVQSLLEGVGPWALLVIAGFVFIESGLLFPFLPGDSLLVTAGLIHHQLGLTLPIIIAVAFVAAAAGDQVGYLLGTWFGPRLFKDDARILKTSRLRETEAFFAKFGGRALVLGRFVPIIRTYVPLAAGSARYPYRRFLPWNLAGAFLWVVLVTVVGSLLGGVPFIVNNIDVLLTVVVVVSVLPIVIDQVRKRVRARRAADAEADG
ncbi:DedA family protein [Amnibacterium sp.]|uniref:DedA family protein n=1 Tax=Amnibacterium sp. TaxID=1872496 RepID=UPI003F7BA352